MEENVWGYDVIKERRGTEKYRSEGKDIYEMCLKIIVRGGELAKSDDRSLGKDMQEGICLGMWN